MLWDLIQHTQIEKAQRTADNAKSVARDARDENHSLKRRVEMLEQRLERVSLATMALSELIRDRLGVTEADIEAKVHEIDLRDGKLDGRFQAPSHSCSHCQHENAPHRLWCLYCGEELPATSGNFAP